MRWFEQGNVVNVDDRMTNEEFYNTLVAVPTLAQLASSHFNIALTGTVSLATAMEFILDALHQHSKLAKDDSETHTVYKDLVGSMFALPTMLDDEEGLGA